MNLRLIRAALLALLFAGCSQIDANNPYDPKTPGDQQAHGVLRGRIVAPAGFDLAQVEEVSVDLLKLDADEGDEPLERAKPAVDGADVGRFVFDDVIPGRYRLAAAVTGFSADVLVIEIAVGETVNVGDLALRTQLGSESQGTLSGVAERGGAPAGGHAGISVQLEGTPFAARTNADGRFALDAPAALYTVTFSDPGFGTESVADVRIAGGGAPTELPEKVVLTAQPGSIRGVLVAPGAPEPDLLLPRADVVLFAADDATDTPVQTLNPDATGRFAFADVGAGAWRVLFTLDTYAPAEVDVTVAPGEAVDLRRVVLEDAPAGTARGHAFLALALADGHQGIRVATDFDGRFTETLADGSYALDLPAGHHNLNFAFPGYASPDEIPVDIVAGEALDVLPDATLGARAGTIRGNVVLTNVADQTALLPDVNVTLSRAGEPLASQNTNPNDSGDFSFTVTPGVWQVSLTLDTFAPAEFNVDVAPGETVDLRRIVLLAAPLGTMRGTAHLGGAGAGQHAGIRVDVRDRPYFTETDPDGAFSLDAPAGTYEFTFSHPGYGLQRVADVRIEAGMTRDLESLPVLPADPGGVRGLVRLPRGYEDPGRMQSVVLRVYPAGVANNEADPTAQGNPAVDGSYLFNGLAAGAWRVEADLPDINFDGSSSVEMSARE